MANSFEEECDYLFKAVLIGDSAVGKSNLLSRFARKEFHLDSKPTIGVEFAYRNIQIGDKLIKAQIWDTAGQERCTSGKNTTVLDAKTDILCRFRAITSSYYRGALGALLVYDTTRRTTFENLKKWLHELREFASPDMVIVLLGNKSDLNHSREVNVEEGQSLAQKENLFFMETSARENVNVEEAFLQMVGRIFEIANQKSIRNKTKEATNPTLQGKKESIYINEVSATKQNSSCCSY